MDYYLIDLENVNSTGLEGADLLVCLSLLHAFGRDKGLKVYQYMKTKHQGPFAPGSPYIAARSGKEKTSGTSDA